MKSGTRKLNICKKALAILMVLALLGCVVPSFTNTSAAISKYGRTDDGDWSYELLSEGAKTVSIRPTKIASFKGKALSIPSKVTIKDEEYTVTTVANNAFINCVCNDCLSKARKSLDTAWADDGYSGENVDLKVTDVTIPSTVTTLEEYCMGNIVCNKVTIQGNSLKTIEEGAFSGVECSSFKLPTSVTSLGEGVFEGSVIPSISFDGTKLTTIPAWTFASSNLKSFTIPSTITKIGEQAFNDTSLKTITIPNAVKSLGAGCFMGSSKLTSVTLGSDPSLTTIPKGCFIGTKLAEFTVPDSISAIQSYAFSNISSLKTLNIERKTEFATLHKKAFCKVSGFDADGDDLDDIGDYSTSMNKTLKLVNLNNYDIYNQIKSNDMLGADTSVYSKKTRIFLGDKKDSKGDVNMGSDEKQSISIKEYIPEKTGYHYEKLTFDYVDDFGKDKNGNIENDSYTSKGYPFTVINAVLKGNKYELAYQPGSADVLNMPGGNTTCTYDDEVEFTSVVPSRVGHDFAGWSVGEASGSNTYQSGAKVNKNFTSKAGEIIPVYATWTPKKMEIIVNATGGKTKQTTVNAKYGDSLYTVLDTPTREDYDFVGWSLTADGKPLAKNYTISIENNFKVYAIWKKNRKRMTITFSKPKSTSSDSYFEVTITEDGDMIQSRDIRAEDIGNDKIVLPKAKVGSKYVITCTNYKKDKGKKKYYKSTTKKIVVK